MYATYIFQKHDIISHDFVFFTTIIYVTVKVILQEGGHPIAAFFILKSSKVKKGGS